jgi:hexulose-6-phosphate isomerase
MTSPTDSLVGNPLGIYEKALPAALSWTEKLETAKRLGFAFVEISVDESDDKLDRLYWSRHQRGELRDSIWNTGVKLHSMCFSGQRRFPLGSRDPKIRAKSLELMQRAIQFASEIGIRVIQLAGYDVYYEQSGPDTHALFLQNLLRSVDMASQAQVMLAIEIMDTSTINSISKFLWYDREIHSPWLAVYPDIGNLAAWGNEVETELRLGIHRTVGVHLKDTLAVTRDFPGKFRDVPFGNGCVDFPAVFRVLKGLHYKGPFVIEMWTAGADDALEQILAAKTFILAKMAESDAVPG